MGEPTYPMSQGSSAPVAIVLALALAATVGVSAQSWDVKVAARPTTGTARPATEAAATPEEGVGGSLLRHLLPEWAQRGRPADCSSR